MNNTRTRQRDMTSYVQHGTRTSTRAELYAEACAYRDQQTITLLRSRAKRLRSVIGDDDACEAAELEKVAEIIECGGHVS
jgi:hypothetical protein